VGNLEEMDKLQDAFDQTKMNQEGISHPNRSITSNETQAVIKSSNKEKPRANGFTAKFYQTFKGLTPTLLKLFGEIDKEGTLSNSSYETSITFIPKLDKDA
jgi:hypothetical protein